MDHLQQPRSFTSPGADVPPLGVRSRSWRQPMRIRLSAVSQPVGGSASGEQLGAAASCPFSSAMQKLQGLGAANPSTVPDERTVITPGPKALSLASLGDVFTIFTDGLHAAMLNYSQKYGPVCRFANPVALNGAAGWVFVNSPTDIQHICATNTRNYQERYLPDIYKYVTHEKGILGSSGEYNRRHRKLVHPPFRTKALLAQFGDIVTARAQQVADAWESQEQPFLTDIATQSQRLTLDIVGLVAFSHDFQQTQQIVRDFSGRGDSQSAAQDRLLWAVNTFGEVLGQVFITPMPLLHVMESLGMRQLRLLDEAVGVMRDAMLGVIQERREQLAAGELAGDDLLDMLLLARDEEGRGMTDEELWEDVHDVMGAGHETTATTTAAVLYCVSTHPEVEEALLEELREVVGDRPPTFADLERLPYLAAVVKETLRLYPAIPVFPRQAESEDKLPSGHAIHAGDVVFMSSYALGRSPGIWQDPLRFDPARFAKPESEAGIHRFAFLPFGAGPRMCLGAAFAQMSVSLVVATLLQRLRFRAVHPSTQLIPVAYDITMNYSRTNGLAMEVSRRQ